jgi:glycosyltransferase involved in cell wall biosynthesis
MESGSGSNVKVAEYLAAGLPVVTTPVGLRGYEAFAHRVTVVELDGFPEALLGRHPRATDTSELQELSWEALGRRLHGIYRELVTRRKSERGR